MGNNDGIGPGVAGRSSKGEGVVGQGTTNGMHGIAPGSENEHSTIPSGVWGENTGDGIGVKGSANGGIGVLGVSNSDTGVGISGINHAGGSGVNGESVDGAGVVGGSLRGYGGDFSGGLAPIRLKPGPTSGRPTDNNHSVGELYLDNAGNLFLCITAGTPGSWAQIRFSLYPNISFARYIVLRLN